MKLVRRRMLFGSAALLFAGRSAGAEVGPPPSLDQALAEVAKARAGLRTLVGPFTQTRTIGLLAAKVQSSGTLTLVRPDRLRWELAAPDDVVYWVTPEGLAYRSRSGQGRAPAGGAKGAALDDLRVLLGGDLSLLRARYDLSVASADGDALAFDARPRPGPAAPPLERLAFTVAADRVTPTRATLVEGPRDRSEIVFGSLAKNVPVDPALVRPPA